MKKPKKEALPGLPDVTGKCGSCKYADKSPNDLFFCRRYPAQLISTNGQVQALYPVVTLAVDWCGEHQPI